MLSNKLILLNLLSTAIISSAVSFFSPSFVLLDKMQFKTFLKEVFYAFKGFIYFTKSQ